MIDDPKIRNIVETLTRTGLAASPTEALRMAQSIVGTEKKVVQTMDKFNEEMDKTMKKTYQEKMNDLIEKTSPEKKDFFIPIKGYQLDEKAEMKQAVAQEDSPAEVKTQETKDVLVVPSVNSSVAEEKPLSQLMQEGHGNVETEEFIVNIESAPVQHVQAAPVQQMRPQQKDIEIIDLGSYFGKK